MYKSYDCCNYYNNKGVYTIQSPKHNKIRFVYNVNYLQNKRSI